MPNFNKTLCPINIQSECFTTKFSPEKLIYLTSDSNHVLNLDDINENTLILGAINCKATSSKYSLDRAVSLGIRTAKIPVDRYLSDYRSRILEIDVVMKVLHDFRLTKNWRKSLAHVPRRNFL